MCCPTVAPPHQSAAPTQPHMQHPLSLEPALPSQRAKLIKRTKAEQAAEPNKGTDQGKGEAARAKPAPQPGRWIDRDFNAVLNMQHFGAQVASARDVLMARTGKASSQRKGATGTGLHTLDKRPGCTRHMQEQTALPAKGKEYPGLGYKRVSEIEKTFGVDASAAAAAPVAMAAGPAAAAAPVVEEKTTFDVVLEEIPADKKVAIYKVVRSIANIAVNQVKDFTATLPKVLKEGASKEDAEEARRLVADAVPPPQAPPWGRWLSHWLDRDTNGCLNFQRIGESMQRPLELCSWTDLKALPPVGKEYQQRYKLANDRLPKVRQRLHRAAEYLRGIDGRARNA
ncbi:hypothetical protein QJQ45_004660 [Haematococcus lacustris]|nr:hypothetical protein QJQ45_004660 [Haematococcus lacustris]